MLVSLSKRGVGSDSLTNECSIYEISANGNAGTILLSAGSTTDGGVGGSRC